MKVEEEGRGERRGAEMERSETKGKRRREEKRGGEKRIQYSTMQYITTHQHNAIHYSTYIGDKLMINRYTNSC